MDKLFRVLVTAHFLICVTMYMTSCKEAKVEKSPAPINYKREIQDPLSESKRFTYGREGNQRETGCCISNDMS